MQTPRRNVPFVLAMPTTSPNTPVVRYRVEQVSAIFVVQYLRQRCCQSSGERVSNHKHSSFLKRMLYLQDRVDLTVWRKPYVSYPCQLTWCGSNKARDGQKITHVSFGCFHVGSQKGVLPHLYKWMGLTIAALHDRRFDPWVSATLWLTGSASIARQGCAGRRGLVLVLRRVWRW